MHGLEHRVQVGRSGLEWQWVLVQGLSGTVAILDGDGVCVNGGRVTQTAWRGGSAN